MKRSGYESICGSVNKKNGGKRPSVLPIYGRKSSGEGDAEENADLVGKFGVMQAPTLIVIKDNEVEKYANASSIKGFADKNR